MFVSRSIFYSPQSDAEADLLWKSKSVSSAAPPTLAICFSYLTPVSWVPYGLAESWHGAQRSAVLLGVMSDRPPLVCPALPSVAVGRHCVLIGIDCFSLIIERLALIETRPSPVKNLVGKVFSVCSQTTVLFCRCNAVGTGVSRSWISAP